MAITEYQKEKRKNHIGSSDISAIMGLDLFRTAYDVWLEKTDRLEDSKTTVVQARGNFLETAILNWFESTFNKPILRNQYRSAKMDGLPFGSNIDAIVQNEKADVEAKSVGNYSTEQWGESGTDDVPDRVIVQCTFHMICDDAPKCYVPVYLPYKDFCCYQVELNKDLAEMIIQAGLNFWNNHVMKDIPPEKVAPSIDIAKRIRRQPNKTVSISETLINTYEILDEELKLNKKNVDKAKALILATLDGAEEGVTETGRKVTNFLQKRAGYTVQDTEFAVLRFPRK